MLGSRREYVLALRTQPRRRAGCLGCAFVGLQEQRPDLRDQARGFLRDPFVALALVVSAEYVLPKFESAVLNHLRHDVLMHDCTVWEHWGALLGAHSIPNRDSSFLHNSKVGSRW